MPELAPINHSCLDPWLADLGDAPRWCVAFSGGPDSTVLLHLMRSWCLMHPEGARPLVAIHVNHGLQCAADDWQTHCEEVCNGWNIPIITARAELVDTGQGVEAAARRARYKLFETELGAGDVLFMGHHLDDQVETYFLRLLRGSGLSGLSAMPGQRPLGKGMLVRPLITRRRSELEQYLSSYKLVTVDDPSNTDTAIDRNYLRQRVLPLLAERWEGYRQTVSRAADHAAVNQALIEECLPAPRTVFSVLGDLGIEQSELDKLSLEAATVTLRHWLRSAGCSMPDQVLLAEFMRQLSEGSAASSPRLACSSFVLQRYQGRIYLLPEDCREEQVLQARPVVSLSPGEVCDIPGVGQLNLHPAQEEGLLLGVDDSLELRWRLGGERCRPRGRPYNQRLKKLFQEFGVPPWWRERVPLLYLEEELLAVGDLWLCESSRLVTESTPDTELWRLCWQRKPLAFD